MLPYGLAKFMRRGTSASPCPDSVLISLKETPEKFAREATGNIVVPEAVETELEAGQNNLSIRLFKS